VSLASRRRQPRGYASRLAGHVWDVDVAGSNPVAPTIDYKRFLPSLKSLKPLWVTSSGLLGHTLGHKFEFRLTGHGRS
jgi:hypothetical protein